MRVNLEGAIISKNLLVEDNRFGVMSQTLGANIALGVGHPHFLFLAPSGADRNVVLPPKARGRWHLVCNTAASVLNLNVRDDSDTFTVAVIERGQFRIFVCDGTAWRTVNPLQSALQGRPTFTKINTAGNVTYTAAQFLSGVIVRDPNGAGRTDTLPSAASLVAAIPGCGVGDTISCKIVNGADAAETLTISAGTGGSYPAEQTAASQVIAQNNSKVVMVRFTNVTSGSEAYEVCL